MKKIALSLFVVAASGAYVWAQPARKPVDSFLDGAAVGAISRSGSIATATPASATSDTKATARLVPMVTLDTAPPPPPPASQRPSTVALAQPDAAPQKAQAPAKPAAETALSFADAPPLTQAPLPTQDPAPAPQPVASGPVVNVPLPRLRPPHTVVASLSPPSRPARSVRPTIAPTRVAAVQSGFADGTFTGPSVYAYYGRVQVQAIIQNGRLVAIKMLDYPSDRRTSLYINRQALPMLRDEVIQAQSANVDMISGATLTSQGFIRSLAGALRKATRA